MAFKVALVPYGLSPNGALCVKLRRRITHMPSHNINARRQGRIYEEFVVLHYTLLEGVSVCVYEILSCSIIEPTTRCQIIFPMNK